MANSMHRGSVAQIPTPPPLSGQDNACQFSYNTFDGDRSETSLNTVHRNSKRDISLGSTSSYGSFPLGQLRVRNANIQPSRNASASNLHRTESPRSSLYRPTSSRQASHKSSWGTEIPVPPKSSNMATCLHDVGHLEDVDLNFQGERTGKSARTNSFVADPYLSLQVTQEMVARSFRDRENSKPSTVVTKFGTPTTHPFRRWISTLRRKGSKNIGSLKVRQERWSLDDFEEAVSDRPSLHRRQTIGSHRKTSSWASSGLAEAVKSAKAGLGTSSVAPLDRKNRKSIIRGSDNSSRISYSGNRTSIDSDHASTYILDEAALARGIQRKRALEELVSSEESYISDLKVLVNVVSP